MHGFAVSRVVVTDLLHEIKAGQTPGLALLQPLLACPRRDHCSQAVGWAVAPADIYEPGAVHGVGH